MTDFRTNVEHALAAFAEHRERTAIVYRDRTLTYAELLDTTHRLARALLDLGVGPGQIVTTLGGNAPELLLTRYAVSLTGAGLTELYSGMSAEAKARIVDDVDTALLVVHAEFAAEADKVLAASSPQRVIGLGAELGVGDLLRLAAAQPADPVPSQARAEDIQHIRHTGGTSGHPKGVCYTFQQLSALSQMRLGGAPAEARRMLVCTTIAHVGGGFADGTLAGGHVVHLHDSFDPGAVLATIERERITDLWLLPPLLYQLQDHPDYASRDLSSLRGIVYGGCRANPERLAAAVRRFGPILMQVYGQTEAGMVSVLTPPEHAKPELLATAGRVFPGTELTVRDEQGEVLPAGQIGEFWSRGSVQMAGYWKQPELSATVLRDGWVRTGDLGFLDADGYVHVLDRLKDMIIVVGGHVYTSEVEDVLQEHPGVRAAAVFGLPDPDGAEQVHAAVVADGVTAPELIELVRERKGRMYQPARIHFRTELPLTDAGKPDKKAIKAQISAGAGDSA